MSVPTSYTSAYPMAFREMDCRGLCRPTILPELMQDTATIHAEQMGMGRRVLLQKARAIFMLSRLYYFLNRPVRPGGDGGGLHLAARRPGRHLVPGFFADRQGVSLGRATSCWCWSRPIPAGSSGPTGCWSRTSWPCASRRGGRS